MVAQEINFIYKPINTHFKIISDGWHHTNTTNILAFGSKVLWIDGSPRGQFITPLIHVRK